MDPGRVAALLESKSVGRGDLKDRLMAAILQMMASAGQPAPDPQGRVPSVVVGVLRAEEPEDELQWRCKVLTCTGSSHPLRLCPQFLKMPAEERRDLVGFFNICR
jgi:hypothetical protein